MGLKSFLQKGERDYESFVRSLSIVCKQQSLEMKTLGSANGKDIYLVTLGPGTSGKTLCFVGGVHGNEEAGPIGILKWLEQVKDTEHRILVIPCANPYGFQKDIRSSSTGDNLNRRWCEKPTEGEAGVLSNFFSGERIDFFYSVHEDPTARHFYLYYSDDQGVPFYRDLLSVASKYFDLNQSDNIRGDQADAGAIAFDSQEEDCSIEGFLYKTYNVPYVVNETPGTASLATRVRYIVESLNLISSSFG